MPRRYFMVRVREETHLSLLTLAELWARLVGEGEMRPLRTTDDGMVSLDAVIEELIRRDWDHRQRASKNSPPKRPAADGRTRAKWRAEDDDQEGTE